MKTEIIVSLILSLMLVGCDTGEQEIIIVPKDYTGYILVIFNQEEGEPVRYEGRKRVYEIPQNGILKTQFSGNYGSVGFAEFYYKNIDPGNKLSSFAEMEKVPGNTVVGFRGPTGTVKKSRENDDRIEFVEFYVGSKAQIDQAREDIKKLDIVKLAE